MAGFRCPHCSVRTKTYGAIGDLVRHNREQHNIVQDPSIHFLCPETNENGLICGGQRRKAVPKKQTPKKQYPAQTLADREFSHKCCFTQAEKALWVPQPYTNKMFADAYPGMSRYQKFAKKNPDGIGDWSLDDDNPTPKAKPKDYEAAIARNFPFYKSERDRKRMGISNRPSPVPAAGAAPIPISSNSDVGSDAAYSQPLPNNSSMMPAPTTNPNLDLQSEPSHNDSQFAPGPLPQAWGPHYGQYQGQDNFGTQSTGPASAQVAPGQTSATDYGTTNDMENSGHYVDSSYGYPGNMPYAGPVAPGQTTAIDYGTTNDMENSGQYVDSSYGYPGNMPYARPDLTQYVHDTDAFNSMEGIEANGESSNTFWEHFTQQHTLPPYPQLPAALDTLSTLNRTSDVDMSDSNIDPQLWP